MNHIFVFVMAVSFLFSCTENDQILAVIAQKNNTSLKIDSLYIEMAGENKAINALKTKHNQLQYQCRLLMDSTEMVVQDNPMAAAYIHNLDKSPIAILEEYIDTLIENEAAFLLLKHLVLWKYGDENRAHVDEVRTLLYGLDREKKTLLYKKRMIAEEIERHTKRIEDILELIAQLKKKEEDLDKQLSALNS